MHVALVDFDWEGHHTTYLKAFSGGFLKLGCELTVFCPKPEAIREWVDANLVQYRHHLRTATLIDRQRGPGRGGRARRAVEAVARWRQTQSGIDAAVQAGGTRPDLVFFCKLDGLLDCFLPGHLIDFVFRHAWSGLYLHPPPIKVRSTQQAWLSNEITLTSARCLSVAVLNEGLAEELNRRIARPVIPFPDCTDSSLPEKDNAVANAIRRAAAGRKIVGMLGSLEKRKGMVQLLKIAEEGRRPDVFYVFCGKLAEASFSESDRAYIQERLRNTPTNCYFHLQHIPDGPQFNALVDVCDVLFAVYEQFPHSSNVLTKAAWFRKPVLVSCGEVMEERVVRYGLGLSVRGGHVACRSALERLLDGAVDLRPDYDGFLRLNSETALAAALTRVMAHVPEGDRRRGAGKAKVSGA